MILADTNVWSVTMKPDRNDAVLGWIDRHWDSLVLSSIVIAELRYGAAKIPAGRRHDEMVGQVDRIERHKVRGLLGFGSQEAAAYGELMGRMRRAGTPLPLLDGQIAAQALANGLSIATRNVADFERTGVEVLNPWNGRSPPPSG